MGPIYAAQRALRLAVPRWLVDANVWVITAADLRDFLDADAPEGSARWAGEADLEALAAFGMTRDEISAWLARGDRVAVMEAEDDSGRGIVAWNWYATEYFDQRPWLRLTLGERETMGTLAVVAPAYRGKGLANRVSAFAFRDFARQGYLRDYGLFDALNRNSLKAFAKMGHQPIGRIAYVRCLGLTVLKVNNRARAGVWSAANSLRLPLRDVDASQPGGVGRRSPA